MRLETVQRNVQQSGFTEVSRATIKATPKIFDFFANQTYANKPEAICRELVANGIDSHIAAGIQDRPVEVTIPTILEPVFRVRDFGIGMSHDFVMGPFMAYTDGSTKDQANDQIGGFGIGSKSPFAYCDQYTLRVVHEGVLSIYTMFKAEDGIPCVALQATKTTDEHNGVEISFPVELEDMGTFQGAAQQALQYFRPLPLVINGVLNPPDYTHSGKDWALRPAGGELGIIMGGVRYPVTKASLEWDLKNDARLSPLLEYGIDLTLPIGSCSVALSRESLSYDKKTSETIKAALEGVIDDVVQTFANIFDNEPTEWAAMVKLHNEIGGEKSSWNTTPRQKLMAANAKYKGQPLETNFNIEKEVGFKVWNIEPKRGYGRIRSLNNADWRLPDNIRRVYPGKTKAVIIDNMKTSPKNKVLDRIREYVETIGRDDQHILVIRTEEDDRENDKNTQKILKQFKVPTNVVFTADLPEPIPTTVAAAAAKQVRPKVRMFTYDGRAKVDHWSKSFRTNLTPSYATWSHVKEVPYVDQPDKGLCVVMDSFDLPGKFYETMETGLITYDELHFVNKGDWEKIKGNWKSYEIEAAARLQKALAARPELCYKKAVLRSFITEYSLFYLALDRSGLVLNARQKSSPFGKMKALYETYVTTIDETDKKLFPFVEEKAPPRVDFSGLRRKFQDDQPEVILLTEVLQTKNDQHVQFFFNNL